MDDNDDDDKDVNKQVTFLVFSCVWWLLSPLTAERKLSYIFMTA